MSWWTKNRKKVGLGLLGGAALASGVGAPLIGGLLGEGSAVKAGMAGAKLAPELMGPTTAGAKGLMGLGSVLGGASPQITPGGALLASQGLGLMGGQQQEPMAPPPPPPPAAPQPPMSNFGGYGMQGDPFAGMSEEQKRRILAMIQQGGMR